MRQNAFRNAFLALLMSLVAGLLAACGGGGGATTNTISQGGVLVVNGQGQATAYAGVPFTMTITGGKAPYVLTSSEPSIIPLPQTTTNSTVTFVPNNPSTIDSGLQPNELPVKSVIVTVRDSSAQTANNTIKVAQNYLIGYGFTLTPTTCPAGTTTTAGSACSGGETALRLFAASNGTFAAGRTFTITNLRGNYTLRNPVTGQAGSTIQAVSDGTGQVIVLVQVPPNTQSQIGVVRIQDTSTGQYSDNAFLIAGVAGSTTGTGNLTIIPDKVTYTAALSTSCGTGTSTVLVFDGTPPYTAVASDPNVRVTAIDPNHQPGVFEVSAFNPNICLTGSTVTFFDSVNRRGTMSIDTKKGENDPPKLTVAPTSVTLACGQTSNVTVAGGVGPYSAQSSNPRVVAFAFGNQVGMTRVTGDGPTVYPTTGAVSITDGSSVVSVDVTSPANCP